MPRLFSFSPVSRKDRSHDMSLNLLKQVERIEVWSGKISEGHDRSPDVYPILAILRISMHAYLVTFLYSTDSVSNFCLQLGVIVICLEACTCVDSLTTSASIPVASFRRPENENGKDGVVRFEGLWRFVVKETYQYRQQIMFPNNV